MWLKRSGPRPTLTRSLTITGVIMWVSFWYTFNILLRLHLSDSREPKRKRPVFPNCTMEHPIIHYYTFVFLYIFHPNLWTWYYYKWFSPLLLCTIAFVLILWKFFNCITTSSTPTEQFIRFYPWFCLLYLGTNTNDFLHFWLSETLEHLPLYRYF